MEGLQLYSNHGVTIKAVVANGMAKPIRLDCKSPDFNQRLSVVLTVSLVHYCGMQEENMDLAWTKEVYEFITKSFGDLGVNEVQEAFRLAASKVIDVDISAYHGRLTLKTLGELLYAYKKFRDPIKVELLKTQEQRQREDEEEQDRIKKQQYIDFVLDWWDTVKLPMHYKEIPHYIYETLIELKKIRGEEVVLSWFVVCAKVYAVTELKAKMNTEVRLAKELQYRNDLKELFTGGAKNVLLNDGKRMYIYAALWKSRGLRT